MPTLTKIITFRIPKDEIAGHDKITICRYGLFRFMAFASNEFSFMPCKIGMIHNSYYPQIPDGFYCYSIRRFLNDDNQRSCQVGTKTGNNKQKLYYLID